MGRTLTRRPHRALAATAIFGMVGTSLAMMGTAHAAVMLSGSTIDSAGNYVEGSVSVYDAADTFITSVYADSGAFDIPLDNGTYKLRFSPSGTEFTPEYYRDKADYATADVVTVNGAAQTLAAWTIDRKPSVVGVVTTTDGRAVRYATVEAYDAGTGNYVGGDQTERNGAFRIGATVPVKLVFRGADPASGRALATEWFNDKASLATADPVTPTPEGLNLGAVTLAPGGSIAGRVTSEAGAPIYRAEVCSDGYCDYTNTAGAYLIEGVSTGTHEVEFYDPIGEFVGEYWNNVPLDSLTDPTPVTVAPGQVVTGVDAALAAMPVTAPNGVDVSGTVRDELGGLGIGYTIRVLDTPADPRDAKVVASTVSNRAGQYQFSQLDRIGGETEFKIEVVGEAEREDGEFARRTIWAGDKLGYETAVPVSAAPRVLDFVQPVAGGISGTVTSEAGGVPQYPYAAFRDSDQNTAGSAYQFELDGSYDERSVWAGDYTVQLGAQDHVSQWWKGAVAEDATVITVRPGQMVTGISAVLAKDVKAIERPEVMGNAWVGKTLRLDKGRWTTEADSAFTYEWLVGSTVVATGPSLKVTKSLMRKKIVGRVTNDAGFTQGQAVTASTVRVGYQPKIKAKVSGNKIALKLKAKPLKAKKVKAKVKVYELVGVKKNGDDKLKKLGKATIKKGVGVATLKKPLAKGKHTLVFSIKGKGKVGSGDLTKKVKIKR